MADETLKQIVKAKYGQAAQRVTSGGGACCGSTAGRGECDPITTNLYGVGETAGLPAQAVAASLGCGNPTAVADLRPGETVLDLGSGGGIDVLLSANRVGPTGKVYGLDMTDEMLALAIRNRDEAGATNVEFLKGYIEDIPLPASTVDVVISNCVVNLSTDKPRVFSEIHRVLRAGGRIGIADVVAAGALTPPVRAERGTYVGCVAGALSFREYEQSLRDAGFVDISITATHEDVPGIHSTIIKARKRS